MVFIRFIRFLYLSKVFWWRAKQVCPSGTTTVLNECHCSLAVRFRDGLRPVRTICPIDVSCILVWILVQLWHNAIEQEVVKSIKLHPLGNLNFYSTFSGNLAITSHHHYSSFLPSFLPSLCVECWTAPLASMLAASGSLLTEKRGWQSATETWNKFYTVAEAHLFTFREQIVSKHTPVCNVSFF